MTKMNSISGLLKQFKKSNAVPLIVPKNIGKDLAPTALRYGISSTALSAFLASLINLFSYKSLIKTVLERQMIVLFLNEVFS